MNIFNLRKLLAPDVLPSITTAWWKLLFLTLASAGLNYLLAFGLMQVRIEKPTWAMPIIELAEKSNPEEIISEKQSTISEVFYKWDTYYYVTIARDGYDTVAFNTNKRYNWAFFPLYPAILKSITSIPGVPQTTQSYLVIGMILSNIFFFCGLLVWKRLANLLQMTQAQWNFFLLFLLFFPLSYVYHMVFTESLFFFVSSLALYLIAKHKYLPAAWVVGLAAVTRITGIFLVPLLLYAYYRDQMKERIGAPQVAWLGGLTIITLTPIALFFNYLAALTGELLAPLKIQAAWNNDGFVPFSSFIGYLKDYGLTFHQDHGLSILLLLLSWALLIYAAVITYSKRTVINRTQALLLFFSIALVFINSSINSRSSIFRYTTTIPYLFVVLGYIFSKGMMRIMAVPILSILLLFHVLFFAFFLWKIPIYGF